LINANKHIENELLVVLIDPIDDYKVVDEHLKVPPEYYPSPTQSQTQTQTHFQSEEDLDMNTKQISNLQDNNEPIIDDAEKETMFNKIRDNCSVKSASVYSGSPGSSKRTSGLFK
jgi:hypothetical protein